MLGYGVPQTELSGGREIAYDTYRWTGLNIASLCADNRITETHTQTTSAIFEPFTSLQKLKN